MPTFYKIGSRVNELDSRINSFDLIWFEHSLPGDNMGMQITLKDSLEKNFEFFKCEDIETLSIKVTGEVASCKFWVHL